MSTFLQLKARGDFHTYDSVTLCDGGVGSDKLLSLKGSTTLDSGKTLTLGNSYGNDNSGTGIQLSNTSLTIKDGSGPDPALFIKTDGTVEDGKGELNAYRTARFHGSTNGLALVTNYAIQVGASGTSKLKSNIELTGSEVKLYGLNAQDAAQPQTVTFSGEGSVQFQKQILHQTTDVDGNVTSTNFTLNNTDLNVNVPAEFEKNVRVRGDLLVEGTTVTKNSTELNVGDRHIYLNAANTSTSATNGGVVVNYQAKETDANVTSITGGVIALDTNAVTYAAGAIVQISGAVANPSLNGLYKVQSEGTNSLTVVTSPQNITAPFIKSGIDDLGSGHGETIQLAWVKLGHLQFDNHGVVEFASGHLDSDFDHSKYAAFAGSVDKRSDLQVITSTADSVQHLEKRVVRVDSTTRAGSIYLPPNAYISGTSGDDTWVSSHRVFNNTVSDLTIWARPSLDSGSTYADPGGESWTVTNSGQPNEAGFWFNKSGTVDRVVVASGDSIQLQYVGKNRWMTM